MSLAQHAREFAIVAPELGVGIPQVKVSERRAQIFPGDIDKHLVEFLNRARVPFGLDGSVFVGQRAGHGNVV